MKRTIFPSRLINTKSQSNDYVVGFVGDSSTYCSCTPATPPSRRLVLILIATWYKSLMLLLVLQFFLAGCAKKNIEVVLDIPGNYPAMNKLALAQGLASDIKSPDFLKDTRLKFPDVSQKSIDRLE